MPKIIYVPKKFQAKTLAIIEKADEIIRVYAEQGYNLTLRQLYYQFVSRDILPNKQAEYNRLGSIISDARRAGLIDWEAIVDRTRGVRQVQTWENPQSILNAVSSGYKLDPWDIQPVYIEVWFEKDALMGVFERAANKLRLPYLSCRGYTSDSEIWARARSLGYQQKYGGKDIKILHFGDHDPSGLDMTRDIEARLRLFGSSSGLRHLEVRRLALNMDQIEEYDPPPNPAKETDSRFVEYQAQYGDESWELDALEPTVLAKLVSDEVEGLIDRRLWNDTLRQEAEERAVLSGVSDNWEDVKEYLEREHGIDAPEQVDAFADDEEDEEDYDEEE